MLKNVFFAGNETCEQSVRISVTGGRRFKNGESAAGFSKVNIRSEARPEPHGAMRLNVTSTSNVHKELVACVGWNAFNELYSCGDDKTVSRWDINGDAGGKVRTDRCPPSRHHLSSPPSPPPSFSFR